LESLPRSWRGKGEEERRGEGRRGGVEGEEEEGGEGEEKRDRGGGEQREGKK